MNRIEVDLTSDIISRWCRKHPQIPGFLQVGANLRTDILDWCMYSLAFPVTADRLYRSLLWDEAAFEQYDTTLGASTIRIVFGSEKDRQAFENIWMSDDPGAN